LEEGVRIEIVVANMFFFSDMLENQTETLLFCFTAMLCYVPVRDSSSPNKIGFFVPLVVKIIKN
jgi:hypothetical protein